MNPMNENSDFSPLTRFFVEISVIDHNTLLFTQRYFNHLDTLLPRSNFILA